MDWLADLFARYHAMIERDGGFVLLLGLYVSMILAERVLYLLDDEHRALWDERDSVANIVTSSANSVFQALGLGLVFGTAYLWLYENAALFRLPNAWWAFAFAFVLNDFLYWLDHYVSHKNGLFWTFHQSHHSSPTMNLTVAARGHFLLPLFQPIYLLLPVLGVSIHMALAVKLAGNLWGIFNHTRLVGRMGALDRWLCTPANHRVHHGTQAKYLDRNYGQTLLVWDRLFGTWQPEEEEPAYGLVTPLGSYNPVTIQTAPLKGLWRQMRDAPSWRARLGHLWHPPGWSPDGKHQRTDELREAAGLPARYRGAAPAPLAVPAE